MTQAQAGHGWARFLRGWRRRAPTRPWPFCHSPPRPPLVRPRAPPSPGKPDLAREEANGSQGTGQRRQDRGELSWDVHAPRRALSWLVDRRLASWPQQRSSQSPRRPYEREAGLRRSRCRCTRVVPVCADTEMRGYHRLWGRAMNPRRQHRARGRAELDSVEVAAIR